MAPPETEYVYAQSAPSKNLTNPPSFPPIRACLFDMDGLLIDSEDIYTLVTNTILSTYSRPPLPWKIKAQLQGRPGPSANAIFQSWAQLPISQSEYAAQQSALQQQHFPSTRPLPGVPALLKNLRKAGVQLALATSSNKRNFRLKTAHLGEFFGCFDEERRVLGDDERIKEGRGKPAPDIYLLAMEMVNVGLRRRGEREVRREECLVFEDSVPGIEAGRRAGMRVVWCPHPGLAQEFEGREETVLAGQIGERADVEEKEDVLGWPGQLGDGWGETLESLELFDYAKYGIGVVA
ncbi:hypothetical protein MMC18_004399 [Xylographa bjoerkii]|nr:hypothetical protein [Xylographa bjoerkii]